MTSQLVPFGKYQPLTKRGISEDTAQKFGYFISNNGEQIAPYRDSTGEVVAQKVRGPNKAFHTTGDFKDVCLFGQHLWRDGGKRIVITEGEIDALSVYEAMPNWPVVSVPNGAQGAAKAIARNLEFLESYDKVILMFDNDDAGQQAVSECVELFSPGKVAVARLPLKDANEMVQAGRHKELVSAIWEAQVYRPDGVVSGADLWDRVSTPVPTGIDYPWEGLNKLTYGMRPCELITVTAGSGVGKSAVTAEVIYWLAQGGITCGVIMLEESLERCARRFLGIHIDKPLHLPTTSVGDTELRKAFDATLGTGRYHFLDAFGSLDVDVLVNRLRFMARSLGCKVILLDHVSMIASGADTDDERRFLDNLMTRLRSFCQETQVTLICVSHLRRPNNDSGHERGSEVSLNQLRGSHAIAQLSDQVWALERDGQAETLEERNTTTVRVLKSRISGMTGPACSLLYDHDTGRLSEVSGFETKANDEAADY